MTVLGWGLCASSGRKTCCSTTDHTEFNEYAALIVIEIMQKGNIVKLVCFPIPLKHNDYSHPRLPIISRLRGMLDLK
jgi:hypothetical protein